MSVPDITWPKLRWNWTWAIITDAEFIEKSEAYGEMYVSMARNLVQKDLETP